MKKHIALSHKKAPCIAILETTTNNPFLNAISEKLLDYGIPHNRILRISPNQYSAETQRYTLPSGKTCSLRGLITQYRICGYVGPGNKFDIPPVWTGQIPTQPDEITLPPTTCQRFNFEATWFKTLVSAGIPILTICGSTQHLAYLSGYNMHYNIHHVSDTKHNPRHPLSTASVPMSPEQIFTLLQSDTSHHNIVMTDTNCLSYRLTGGHISLPSFHNHAVSTHKTQATTWGEHNYYLEPVAYDIVPTPTQTAIVEILENKTQCPVILALQGHPEATEKEPFFAGFVSAAHLYSFELSHNIVRHPAEKRTLRTFTKAECPEERIQKIVSGAEVLKKAKIQA